MGFDKNLARRELFYRSQKKLRDVITSHGAMGEVELSALLALKHNWGQVDWQKVPFFQS